MPWAYSASPALATLRWRYGDQLDWRLVLIGLTERAEQYADRGYTPLRMARGYAALSPLRDALRDHAEAPRLRHLARLPRHRRRPRAGARARRRGASRAAARAVHTHAAARRRRRPRGRAARASTASTPRPSSPRIDDADVARAYEADRALARTAEGCPTDFQGKAARTDGPVRYTAPSLIFEPRRAELEAGGFQPIEAYDVLLANLDPTLTRRPRPRARSSARGRAARPGHRRDRGDHARRQRTRPTATPPRTR